MIKSEDLSDPELERALLAALLADNGSFDRLGHLEADDLADPTHAAVLSAAFDLWAEKRPINLVTLRSRFGHVPFGDHGSVLDYLRSFSFSGVTPDVGDIAASLRDLARRREIQRTGERIMGSVFDHAASPTTLLTDAAREVDDLLAKSRPAGKSLWPMSDTTADLLAAPDDANECLATRLADVDHALGGGFRRGTFALLGGRPSMGKSTVAIATGRRVAREGHGVLLFSMEMSRRDCARRMATDACWSRELAVSYSAAAAGKLPERAQQILDRSVRSLADLPILIEERTGLTMTEIGSQTRRAAELFDRQGKRLAMVIVDHLDHMRPSDRYKGNKVQEVGEYSAGMQRLAKAENVAVLALHQLNRNPESRDNKRPELSDLRDSGRLEQDADVVLFVYRAAYYLERMKFDGDADDERKRKLEVKRNEIELNIAKQRNGPTTTIELFCDMAANAVRDKWRGT